MYKIIRTTLLACLALMISGCVTDGLMRQQALIAAQTTGHLGGSSSYLQNIDGNLTCRQISEHLSAIDTIVNYNNTAGSNSAITKAGMSQLAQIALSVFPSMGSAISTAQSVGKVASAANSYNSADARRQALYKKQALTALYHRKNCAGQKSLTRTARSPLAANIQVELNRLGYQVGTADGIAGRKTIAAIKGFQSKNGLLVDGAISNALLAKLKSTPNNQSPTQNSKNCRTDNQEILLSNGQKQIEKFTMCQTANDVWVMQ